MDALAESSEVSRSKLLRAAFLSMEDADPAAIHALVARLPADRRATWRPRSRSGA